MINENKQGYIFKIGKHNKCVILLLLQGGIGLGYIYINISLSLSKEYVPEKINELRSNKEKTEKWLQYIQTRGFVQRTRKH